MKKINPDKPLTDAEWKKLGKPMFGIDELPPAARKAVKAAMRGRPAKESPKKSVSIRLDADIVDELRSHGRGWQTEVNQILRGAVGKKL